MAMQSSVHFYLNWAKERIDEMDAALASLEGKVGEVQAESRIKANEVLADLRKRHDVFRESVKKQADASEAAWISAKAQLEPDWTALEAEVKKYVESFGKKIEQQQSTFNLQAAAQLKSLARSGRPDSCCCSRIRDRASRRNRRDRDAHEGRSRCGGGKAREAEPGRGRILVRLDGCPGETRAAFDRANQGAGGVQASR